MVDRKGQLEPLKSKAVPRRHQPGIVDEQIDPVVHGQDRVCQPAHFVKARKIGQQDVDSIGAGMLADKSSCRLGPGAVATDHDDPHSGADEAEHGVEPDTRTRPGDDRDPLGSV